MLTGDLALYVRRGDAIKPRLLDPNNQRALSDAANLIAIFDDANGKTRGELDAELNEYVGTGTDYKVLRGLIKLLTDRCEFETASVAEPPEIRRQLFLQARKAHSILPASTSREQTIAQTAAELNCQPEQILAGLYADLPAQQKLFRFDEPTPEALIDRYNVAQAQALLYKCVEMRLYLRPQDAKGYRDIFNAIKYYGLIHSIDGSANDGYEVVITGAASVFHRSQKYGIQMAVFLPSLLNCTDWKMRAEIELKNKQVVFYDLTSEQTELRPEADEPEYDNPIKTRLLRDWAKHKSERWQLEPNREVVDLGRTALVPDFVLTDAANNKVYLEILGFWTPKSLQRRVEEFDNLKLETAKPTTFVLAAWEELRGSRDEFVNTFSNVIAFKRALEPAVLESTADKLATENTEGTETNKKVESAA